MKTTVRVVTIVIYETLTHTSDVSQHRQYEQLTHPEVHMTHEMVPVFYPIPIIGFPFPSMTE